MEDRQLTFTMHVTLLTTLVALSHWGPMGLSSAQDGSQGCCTELEMLAKKFPKVVYEELVEDCSMWLSDMRTSVIKLETNCPIPVSSMCEKFYRGKEDNATAMPNSDWQSGEQVMVRNILRVVDTQNWHKCVIVYDSTWHTLYLLTSSLSQRHIYYAIYDVARMNTSYLGSVVDDIFNVFNSTNIIVISADVTFYSLLFREAEEYDRKLGRTSGLRMFTRWVVTTSSGLEDEVAKSASYFDNVAAVIERRETITANSTDGPWDSKVECILTEIASLMYTDVNGSREFQSSTVLLPSGDVIVDDAFPNIHHGFNTRTLRVGTKVWQPFVIKEQDHSGRPRYTGLCIDLLNELATALNFTYMFVEPPYHEGWGGLNATGHWEGLVGQLYREEVDLVVAPLTFSSERALAMDGTYPFTTNSLAVVFRKPDPDLDKWKTYLRPFKEEVLLCLGVTLIVVTCLVHALAWLHPGHHTAEDEEDRRKLSVHRKGKEKSVQGTHKTPKKDLFPGPSPDDGFWYLYGALLSQGGTLLPTTGSSRMLVASWWLFCIVVGATYSGNLIAFLTVQLEIKPFHTLQEMVEQDDYIWGVSSKTSTIKAVLESTDKMLQEMGRRLLDFAASDPEVLDMDLQVHVKKMMRGGYVYITESVTTEALTREHCELDQIIDQGSVSFPYSVCLPRGSDFTRLFDQQVTRMVEAGLVTKWKADWFADGTRCVHSAISSSSTISVFDVQSTLYLCGIGLGLALICLAVEFLRHRRSQLCSWARHKKGPNVPSDHQEKDPDEGGEKETQMCSVFVVDFGSREEKPRARFFDFSTVEQANHVCYDTVYSTPEDFGRLSTEESFFSAFQERRGSTMMSMTDDIRVTA